MTSRDPNKQMPDQHSTFFVSNSLTPTYINLINFFVFVLKCFLCVCSCGPFFLSRGRWTKKTKSCLVPKIFNFSAKLRNDSFCQLFFVWTIYLRYTLLNYHSTDNVQNKWNAIKFEPKIFPFKWHYVVCWLFSFFFFFY